MSSPDDVAGMLRAESQKLRKMVEGADTRELAVSEIVETYYQVINVSSMITVLKQQPAADAVLEAITGIEETISLFNSKIHPKILADLAESIARITKILSGSQGGQQGSDQSATYEELRQKMSTREFADQYGRGLDDP